MALNKFQCDHFAFVAKEFKLNIGLYVCQTWLKDTLRKSCLPFQTSFPLSLLSELTSVEKVTPPLIVKKRGRPKGKKRISSQPATELLDAVPAKRVKCGLCGQLGHNRRSCNNRFNVV